MIRTSCADSSNFSPETAKKKKKEKITIISLIHDILHNIIFLHAYLLPAPLHFDIHFNNFPLLRYPYNVVHPKIA